jgi:hypothetical protein
MNDEQRQPRSADGAGVRASSKHLRNGRRRIAGFALGLVAVLMGAVFWRVFAYGETFGDRDLGGYYHAAKSLVAPLARASQGVPVWNPFFSSGQPFAANPEHEVFHPLTTLFFLLPFELAFRLQVMLPLLFGVASMYFLLRTLRRSRPASLLGGLAWGFGGYLLSTTNLLPILYAAAILPLSLAFAVRLVRAPRAVDVAWLAICIGLQCLAGEPSTLLAMPLLLAAATWPAWRRGSRRRLLSVGLGLLLGGGIGAAILLPGMHHASKTDRAHGLDPTQTGQWSMPPVRALDLLSPHVLGHVRPGNERLYWGRGLYPVRACPYFYSLYPGLAVTALALAVGRRRLRALLPWLVVAGFGYFYALGTHFPLWRALHHLPLLSSLRFPEKFALLFYVPVVIVAAHGCDAVIMGPRPARRRLGRALLVVAAGAAVAAIGLGMAAWQRPAEIVLPLAALDLLRLTGVAASLLVVLRWFAHKGRTARALAVCSVLALDLATAGWDVVHTQPVAAVAGPPAFLLPLLRRAPDGPIFHAAEWEPTLGQVEHLGKPPRTAQWGLATTLESDFDFTFLRWSNAGARAFWMAVRSDPRLARPLLERRGTEAVVQFRRGARWQGNGVVGPEGKNPVEVSFLPAAQPVVFAAAHVERVQGTDGWLAAVGGLQQRARDSVCVDDARFTSLPGPPAPADVRILWRQPARIALDVEGKGPNPSFLAFNQTWDEGWQLAIDQRAAPLLRVDISLSGFVLPPGRHRVELGYHDPWITAGLFVSVLSLSGCLGLVLLARRRRGRRPARSG